jgi:dihydrofolate reductase
MIEDLCLILNTAKDKISTMRKIIVLTFLSLDGVMQGPGGPTEDPSDEFTLGGWTVPYFDEILGKTMGEQMAKPMNLLLGRKTFEIFANYWPEHESDWPGINKITKYVVSRSLKEHTWNNSIFLSTVDDIKRIKEEEGSDLQVHGSANLIQTLLKNDLVDELWLKIFPVTIGKGKRLFAEGTIPAAFALTDSKISPSGVIVASYKRDGDIKTGSFGN